MTSQTRVRSDPSSARTLFRAVVVTTLLSSGVGDALADESACATCDHLITTAFQQTWYQSSSAKQQEYFHLYDLLNKSVDEFKKEKGIDSSGAYLDVFSGSLSGHDNDAENHTKEIKERIEELIKSSYTGSTVQKYPLELLKSIEQCQHYCLAAGESLTCSVLSIAKDSALVNVLYLQPTDAKTDRKYAGDIALPRDVKMVPAGDAKTTGQSLLPGLRTFQLERGSHPGAFPVVVRSWHSCSVTVPAIAAEAPVPADQTAGCQFSAAFAAVPSGAVARKFTCDHLTPGDKFLAGFVGTPVVDKIGVSAINDHTGNPWVELELISPTAEPFFQGAKFDPSRVSLEDRSGRALDVVLTGTVPAVTDPARELTAGQVTVTLKASHCQQGANPTTCSTVGSATLFVAPVSSWIVKP